MSALLLDLGNSRWKLARARAGETGPVTTGAYSALGGLLAAAQRDADPLDAILLASVVGEAVTASVIDVLHRAFSLPVRQVLSTDAMPDFEAGYREPGQLGVDRVLAMVAARARTRRPLCVVDAGTAVTVDFVDGGGLHLGGFILPGARLSHACLLAKTSIPRDDRVDGSALLGRDTPTAVELGARYAVAGLVERFSTGSAALFPGQRLEVFIGGGDAGAIAPLLPGRCTRLDDLVLQGLAVMAARGGA
jgi:type III pantothenate kinase